MPDSGGPFDWLLGARALRFDDPGVHFAFSLQLAAWEWFLVAVAAAIVAWWSYRRLDGPRWSRVALSGVRSLTLLLLVFLACGPKLTRPNETVERDWVLFLVDRSSSLRIADTELDGARTTRDAQLRAFLSRQAIPLHKLADTKNVLWLGFDSGAYELRAPSARAGDTASPVILDAPVGRRTDLGGAIESGLSRLAARPISGVVVFSDGRASDQLPRPLLRRLVSEHIPVMTVPLGSAEPLSDIAVRSAQGPGVAFVNDNVPIEVELERTGALARAARTPIELVDTLTGAVLLRREVDWPAAPADSDQKQRLTLSGTGAVAGNSRWAVRLVPETPDLVPDNNEQAVTIDLVDRPLNVLYLDGYPRWEYRYLKNLLSREKSVQFAAMLLASGRRYLTEGSLNLDALPNSPAEWERFDVLVMGDVRPEIFTPEQLQQIKQRVSVGGAGLIWIAGEAAVPAAWRGTPLSDLLPIALGPSDAIRPWDRDITIRPTPLADRLGVMRLTPLPQDDGTFWPTSVSDPASNWSRLRWVQRIDASQLKPAAEAVAIAVPVVDSGLAPAQPTPAVITMRFGAGRVLYVATDEIWRWRFGRGEDYPERFWLQMVRLLGRESVARSGRPAILEASPARSEVARPVRITLELQDQALLDAAPASIGVRITKVGETGQAAKPTPDPDAPPAPTPTPTPTSGTELTLRPALGEASGRRNFVGVWIPQGTGRYRVTATDPLLSSFNLTADAEVWLADDELRRPETDHPLLAQLSRDTGGSVLKGDELARLERLLPKREVRVALAPDEQTLWDAPLSLILLLGLLLIEWVGRRLIRLA